MKKEITSGSFEEIIERVLLISREVKVGKYDGTSDVAEQYQLQSPQKAMVGICSNINVKNSASLSGAHTLLSLLVEPFKHPSETLFSTEDSDTSDSLREFDMAMSQ
ncbi:hypothetical protein Tco_0679307 [Tanacetum coccineum]|uniref:Uncharacterized protein n=1 Tax=Tanacetum coccineum TaxID=301880 RepID=A0ABQ4XIG4_9ASTR